MILYDNESIVTAMDSHGLHGVAWTELLCIEKKIKYIYQKHIEKYMCAVHPVVTLPP